MNYHTITLRCQRNQNERVSDQNKNISNELVAGKVKKFKSFWPSVTTLVDVESHQINLKK